MQEFYSIVFLIIPHIFIKVCARSLEYLRKCIISLSCQTNKEINWSHFFIQVTYLSQGWI